MAAASSDQEGRAIQSLGFRAAWVVATTAKTRCGKDELQLPGGAVVSCGLQQGVAQIRLAEDANASEML